MQSSNFPACARESWLRSTHLPVISIWIKPGAVASSTGKHPISRTANYLGNLVCRYFIDCTLCVGAASIVQCFIWRIVALVINLLDQWAGNSLPRPDLTKCTKRLETQSICWTQMQFRRLSAFPVGCKASYYFGRSEFRVPVRVTITFV